MPPWLHEHGEDVLLDVLVSPKSARSRIVGEHDGRLKIQVTAPPVDGRANDALVRFIAAALDISRVQVEVVGGHSNRRKTIRVAQVSAQRALLKLAPIRG